MGQFVRRAPVTTLTSITLVLVFLATHRPWLDAPPVHDLRRAWGAVEMLTWVQTDGTRYEYVNRDLSGPFDVWDGAWWRVPLSTLHHANIWHLLLNLSGLVVFGPWLEVRWGSWKYCVFLVASASVSLIPEYLWGHYALGFSGVCCAIFGSLWKLREHDPDLELEFTEEMIFWMVGGLIAMWMLTIVNVVSIANGAHFAGLAYGYVTAMVFHRSGKARSAYLLSHLLLIPAYWCLVHPVWNGKYHWYLADVYRPRNIQNSPDIKRLELALQCDPQLTAVWQILAREEVRQGQLLKGWLLVLRGLRYNPSAENLWQDARRLWRRMATTDLREPALLSLEVLFGAESSVWLAEIRRLVPPPILIAPDRPVEPTFLYAQRQEHTLLSWEPPPDDLWWHERWTKQRTLPAVDPTDPSSAVEGELL